MPKARKIEGVAGNPPNVVFWCPSCRNNHVVPYTNTRPHRGGVWFFDENFESPTIEPSLRVMQIDGKTTACHVVVTSGHLNFCGDQPNDFKNKTVPMEDCKLIGED